MYKLIADLLYYPSAEFSQAFQDITGVGIMLTLHSPYAKKWILPAVFSLNYSLITKLCIEYCFQKLGNPSLQKSKYNCPYTTWFQD